MLRRRGSCLATILWGVCLFASIAPAQDATRKADEPDYSKELPKIPPKSPGESLKAIQLKAGFHAELVAAEPLIRSPMAMDFDEYGRAFIVELPEYNQYANPDSQGTGAIKRIEDTDGDGVFDKATVYVDKLNYPTAIACWDGGILVGVAPDILYCKDTDGDGVADVRTKLFTGFGMDKAGEGMLNSFRWRIDNRFHIPTGLNGGDIVSTRPDAEGRIPPPINVRGQHLLLDPRDMSIVGTSGGGQHGMSLDDFCRFGFVCGNSEPAHVIMYDGRYLARNPYLAAPAAAINIAPDGKFTKLMRISAVEPWRILRTRLRKAGVIPGSDEGGTPSGFFTGATGITVYRGDAWPAEYRGNLFVGEVANNLVYRARPEPNGVGVTAIRADEDAEFLASSDNWFRPVQFANGPDGNLYILDMYRELIEGAAFLAPQILKHMDVSAGVNQGRIYRIASDGFEFKAPPKLGDYATADLVKLYEHPNAWHRDTASRLVYQRQDAKAIPALKQLAEKSASPLARVMALYSLQGLSALEPELVAKALAAKEVPVKEHAMKLSESLADSPEMRAAVLKLSDDPELRVRYQVAFTLGAFNGSAVTNRLKHLALRDGDDPWMRLAVLSSIGERRGEFLSALLTDKTARTSVAGKALLNAVTTQIAAANAKPELALFLKEVDALPKSEQPLAEELMRTIIAARPAIRDLVGDGKRSQAILAELMQAARETAGDADKKPEDRAAAVRTLAAAEFADVGKLFETLLQSQQPQPVQSAALETLSRFDNDEIPGLLQAAWPSLTPQLRATAIETWFARPAWIGTFLDAIETGDIPATDVDPARAALLEKSEDADIAARATKLFAGTKLARRQDVVDAYQSALDLKGDIDKGRAVFRKSCATCHKLENFGESIGADLKAIKDRGVAAVMLNILDPNREVKPQFQAYVVALDDGTSVTGMIVGETANSLTIKKPDGKSETVLRVNIDELKSTNLSFMPEGLEKQIDPAAMADLLAYLNAIE